jgi:hypothetical protein
LIGKAKNDIIWGFKTTDKAIRIIENQVPPKVANNSSIQQGSFHQNEQPSERSHKASQLKSCCSLLFDAVIG